MTTYYVIFFINKNIVDISSIFFLLMKVNIFTHVYWSFVLMDPFSLLLLEPGSTAHSKNNLTIKRQGGL